MNKHILLIGVVAALILWGCVQRPAVEPKSETEKTVEGDNSPLVAEVGNAAITRDDFEFTFLNLPDNMQVQGSDKEKREWMLDKLIEIELVCQAALDADMDADPTVARQMKKMQQKVLFQAMLEREIGQPKDITEEELRAYYEQHKKDFPRGERYDISHILIKSEDKANEVMVIVRASKLDFADLVRKYSESEAADEGGSLGWFTREEMLPSFQEATKDVKPGDIVGPVKSELGYHIIKIIQTEPPGIQDFEKVRSLLTDAVLQQKGEKAFEDYKNKLMQQYTVKKYPENLPQ